MADPEAATEIGRLTLAQEVARVLRRRRVSNRVRVAVTTAEETQALEATLLRRHAEIERVPIGREVEAPPPIRQEGDTLVVPVLEERVVLVRRLVLTEEIRFRFRTEEEAVALPVTLRRQSVAVERVPVEAGDDTTPPIAGEPPVMQRTLTALFDSRTEAERAAEALRGLNVQSSAVQVHDSSAMESGIGTSSSGSTWLPEEDRATYQEGLRRGGAIVTAEVAEQDLELAMDAMDAAGAVDLDARETEWRSQGWTGAAGMARMGADGAGADAPSTHTGMGTAGSSNPPGTMASRAVDQVAGTNISGAHPENEAHRAGLAGREGVTGREEAIPIAEEHLRVGKRVAHAGRVRVRSYVVETPVEEQVRLREEHVTIERRAADSPGIAGEDLFRERVIEAEETVEEAVVQKDVRVTGEVVVNKEVTEHTETIRDTVRRTEVDIDKDAVANDPDRRRGKGVA